MTLEATNQLLSKQGNTVLRLSTLLMTLEEGQRLPSNYQLSQELDVGIGTLQSAFKYLDSIHAVELRARGQLGTTVHKIDYAKLLSLSGNPWIFGAMPLPYSSLFEGLATGLYQEFEKYHVPMKLSYLRGGKTRIRMLLNQQVDFAVCSRYTAEEANKLSPVLETLCSFGPKSYIEKCGLIFRDMNCSSLRDHMMIGIDEDSYDHTLLNKMLGEAYQLQYINVTYSQLDKLMKAGKIDASFWSLDDRKDFSSCNVVPFDELEENEMVRATQEAVLVIRTDSSKKLLLSHIFANNNVCSVQKQVVNREILPAY